MALAQIIDLEERRRSRTTQSTQAPTPTLTPMSPVWCYVWVPVYVWYVA